MKDAAFAAHRAAAAGLFVLFTLLAIVLGLGDARLLALAMGGVLVSLFALTRGNVRESLGSFAAPLAVIADLALLFCAMSLTGGALSPYALLLPAGVALSWHCEGKPAARFFAVASVLGVVALITLGNLPTSGASHLFPLLGVALAAPALLIALEVSGAVPGKGQEVLEPARPAEPAKAPSRRIAPAVASAPVEEASDRDHEAEILHDLRSPLSVIRVYTDLIQEAARRGELPNAEYLANLAREIDLAERLVGTPAPPPSPWLRRRRTRTSSRSSARSPPRTGWRTGRASASSSSPSVRSFRSSPIRSLSSARSATCSTTPSNTLPTEAKCASGRAARGRRPSSSSRTPAWG